MLDSQLKPGFRDSDVNPIRCERIGERERTEEGKSARAVYAFLQRIEGVSVVKEWLQEAP